MKLFCKESHRYYDYHHRYEFTIAPLNYYERQKIKLKLRHNIDLDKLDNCRVIKVGNRSVTKYITNLSFKQLTSPPVVNNLTSLTHLYLSNNQLTNEHVSYIRKLLPNCNVA